AAVLDGAKPFCRFRTRQRRRHHISQYIFRKAWLCRRRAALLPRTDSRSSMALAWAGGVSRRLCSWIGSIRISRQSTREDGLRGGRFVRSLRSAVRRREVGRRAARSDTGFRQRKIIPDLLASAVAG